MAFTFAISLLLQEWLHSLSKKDKHPKLQYFLATIYWFLSILTAPIGLLALWYSSIEKQVYKDEISKQHQAATDILNNLIGKLETENRNLKEQLDNTYFDRYSEGYDTGHCSGYRNGYIDATKDRIDNPALFSGSKYEQLETARKEAEYHIQDFKDNNLPR